jgi:hypothetical protein
MSRRRNLSERHAKKKENIMKIAIGLALALALALSSAPAIAGDTFHAFSTLPATEQASLTALSDDQLATVEGGLFIKIKDVNANVAVISQANVAYNFSYSKVKQSNTAFVRQSIRD